VEVLLTVYVFLFDVFGQKHHVRPTGYTHAFGTI